MSLLAVFTVGWYNAIQLYKIRADLKHSQNLGCEEEASLGKLQNKVVIS